MVGRQNGPCPRSAIAAPLFGVLVALVLVGCTARSPQAGGRTAELPPLIAEAPTIVREAYDFALAEPDRLARIPCFCGCDDVGHRSVRDCFVREVRPDGTVVWDLMGAG